MREVMKHILVCNSAKLARLSALDKHITREPFEFLNTPFIIFCLLKMRVGNIKVAHALCVVEATCDMLILILRKDTC